jgi:hypothetical protein
MGGLGKNLPYKFCPQAKAVQTIAQLMGRFTPSLPIGPHLTDDGIWVNITSVSLPCYQFIHGECFVDLEFCLWTTCHVSCYVICSSHNSISMTLNFTLLSTYLEPKSLPDSNRRSPIFVDRPWHVSFLNASIHHLFAAEPRWAKMSYEWDQTGMIF